MATQTTPPVVEKPIVPNTIETTEAYIEARQQGKTEDLPVPPPTIEETIKPPEPPKAEEPTPQAIEVAKTDEYLETRKERKKRGGAQVKIDELTKAKEEAERKAAELEAKIATEPPPKEETKPAEEVKPSESKSIEIPADRPKIEDFTDANDYHAAMALWAAKQSTEAAKTVLPATPPPAEQQKTLDVRKEEFDKFLENGKRFIAGHPDFNTVLEAAHIRGLTMTEGARVAITRLAAPEVAYWLARPENDLAARRLMQMDEMQQVIEVGRIAERLAVSPADFISSAPPPGTRLNGTTRNEVPLSQITDTDEYIRRRQAERKSRLRR